MEPGVSPDSAGCRPKTKQAQVCFGCFKEIKGDKGTTILIMVSLKGRPGGVGEIVWR